MNVVFTIYGFVLFSRTLAISVFTKHSQQRYVDLERVRLKGTHRMSHRSFKLRIWISFLLFMISTIIPTYNVKTGLIYTIVVWFAQNRRAARRSLTRDNHIFFIYLLLTIYWLLWIVQDICRPNYLCKMFQYFMKYFSHVFKDFLCA